VRHAAVETAVFGGGRFACAGARYNIRDLGDSGLRDMSSFYTARTIFMRKGNAPRSARRSLFPQVGRCGERVDAVGAVAGHWPSLLLAIVTVD